MGNFLICTFLAVYGNLPSQSQLADWEFAVSQHSAVPQGILVSLFIFENLRTININYEF